MLKQYFVTKRSPLTGNEHSLVLWMYPAQWDAIQPFLEGTAADEKSMQALLPDHSPAECRFLMHGLTSAEVASRGNGSL